MQRFNGRIKKVVGIYRHGFTVYLCCSFNKLESMQTNLSLSNIDLFVIESVASLPSRRKSGVELYGWLSVAEPWVALSGWPKVALTSEPCMVLAGLKRHCQALSSTDWLFSTGLARCDYSGPAIHTDTLANEQYANL